MDDTEQRQHRLAKRLSFRMQAAGEPEQGGIILYDVPLLTAGTWHDSLTAYPTIYTEEALRNFSVPGPVIGYRNHAETHEYADEIGEALNIRYDAEKNAIVADLLFHQETQASRDTLAMIQRRHRAHRPAYVSIEMWTRDVEREGGIYAEDITVTGYIATAEPACKKCQIPRPKAQTANQTEVTNTTDTNAKRLEVSADEKTKPEEQSADEPKQQEQTEPETTPETTALNPADISAVIETLAARIDALEQFVARMQTAEQKPEPEQKQEPAEPHGMQCTDEPAEQKKEQSAGHQATAGNQHELTAPADRINLTGSAPQRDAKTIVPLVEYSTNPYY